MQDETIIRRRASALCIADSRLLCIQYRDPTSGVFFWGVPGGQIEPDESPAITAIRELKEETGYTSVIEGEILDKTTYGFWWDGEQRQCETSWYLARLCKPDQPPARVDDADYIVGRSWITLNDLVVFLSHHSAVGLTVNRLLRQEKERHYPSTPH